MSGDKATQPARVRTYVQALNEALDLAMDRDPEVFLLGEDIGEMGGDFGVTRGLWAKYGEERVRDTPLSEAAIIGASVGSAMMGMRPVAEIMFADFLGECYDQLVNNAAKMHYMFDGQFKAPIVVRTACGGGFGGGPHHSQSVEGWFLNVPGLVIVAPSTPADAKGLLLASIENDNPILFLEHKALYRIKGEVPEGYYTTPLRQAAVMREGKDVTIVATMKMVHEALAAAGRPGQRGHRRRGDRPAHHPSLRRGDRAGVGAQDRACGGGQRGAQDRRHRRGTERDDCGGMFPRLEGAGGAGGGAGHADPLLAGAGEAYSAGERAGRGRRQASNGE